MKCPHCQVTIHENKAVEQLDYDSSAIWFTERQDCPSCKKLIVELVEYVALSVSGARRKGQEISRRFIIPKGSSRPHPSKYVPKEYSKDYVEASLVLEDSPMASAALSRRCLQHLIRGEAKIKARDLATEIQLLIDSNKLPSHLSDSIDAIRNIGNFAAHPIKSTSSGEIIDVENGEAEWNLDVLDGLFDFYFIQPAISKAKKAALNAKLADAGKPASK